MFVHIPSYLVLNGVNSLHFGISNKFKEAIAFAMLAYAYYYDIANNVPTCTGASRKTILGQYAKAL